jgi:preprotein translocase subunit SecA
MSFGFSLGVCAMGRFPMLHSLRSIFDRDRSTVERIRAMQAAYTRLTDVELCAAASQTEDLPRWIALAATAAFRVLGQDMYDVQLRGALALARGSIAEMQTGEGKTLAAVPAISWFARKHRGVHVMPVNDYLARRDRRKRSLLRGGR